MLELWIAPVKPQKVTAQRFGNEVQSWPQVYSVRDHGKPGGVSITVEHGSADECAPPGQVLPFTIAFLAPVERKVSQEGGGRRSVFGIGLAKGLVVPSKAELERLQTTGPHLGFRSTGEEPFQTKGGGYMQEVEIFDTDTGFPLTTSFYAENKDELLQDGKEYELTRHNLRKVDGGLFEVQKGRKELVELRKAPVQPKAKVA